MCRGPSRTPVARRLRGGKRPVTPRFGSGSQRRVSSAAGPAASAGSAAVRRRSGRSRPSSGSCRRSGRSGSRRPGRPHRRAPEVAQHAGAGPVRAGDGVEDHRHHLSGVDRVAARGGSPSAPELGRPAPPLRRQGPDGGGGEADAQALGPRTGALDDRGRLVEAVGGEQLHAIAETGAQVADEPRPVVLHLAAEVDRIRSGPTDPLGEPAVAARLGVPAREADRLRPARGAVTRKDSARPRP